MLLLWDGNDFNFKINTQRTKDCVLNLRHFHSYTNFSIFRCFWSSRKCTEHGCDISMRQKRENQRDVYRQAAFVHAWHSAYLSRRTRFDASATAIKCAMRRQQIMINKKRETTIKLLLSCSLLSPCVTIC